MYCLNTELSDSTLPQLPHEPPEGKGCKNIQSIIIIAINRVVTNQALRAQMVIELCLTLNTIFIAQPLRLKASSVLLHKFSKDRLRFPAGSEWRD